MKKNILKFYLFLLPILCVGQVVKKNEVQKSIEVYVDRPINEKISKIIYDKSDFDKQQEIDIALQKIKSYAKDPNELSNAYYHFAKVFLRNENYSESIFLFKKVDSITVLTNNRGDEIMSNFYLSKIYNILLLKEQSQKHYNKIKQLAIQYNDEGVFRTLEELEIALFIDNLKYCETIPLLHNFLKKKFKYSKIIPHKVSNKSDSIFLAITYSVVSYNILKCNNNIEEADDYLKKSEKIFDRYPIEDNYQYPYVCLDNGIIAAERGNIEKAKEWFDKGKKFAVESNNKTHIARIIEEQIRYGLLDENSIKKYLDQYLIQKNNIKKQSEKIIEKEQLALKDDESDKYEKYIFGLIVIFSMIIICIMMYNQRRKKQLKINFEKILEDNAKEKNENDLAQVSNTTQDKESIITENLDSGKNRIMSLDKENELLEKIVTFEKGEAFTENNFAMAQMATLLGSNAKYINYVLQKHRGKTFSDYINELRIKFIVNKLIENPEYLNYKINYLSEISGFSSHSRFTFIFKKELNISPSDFIEQLNQKNKKTL